MASSASLAAPLAPTGIAGWLAGHLDQAYFLTRLCARTRPLLFSHGYGDVLTPMAAFAQVVDRIAKGERALPAGVIDVTVALPPPRKSGSSAGRCGCRRTRTHTHTQSGGDASPEGGSAMAAASVRGLDGSELPMPHPAAPSSASTSDVFTREVTFSSPWSNQLPHESKTARALWMSPAPGRAAVGAGRDDLDGLQPAEVIIHMPAFGEQGYGSRAVIAKKLVQEHGAANLILMAPFWAQRRPAGQKGHYLRTVGDMITQAFAITAEAAALVEWAALRWPTAKLLVTGFSFGGAMTGTAGCVAASLLPAGQRHRLGVVPCVGSATPAVIVDGVLEGDVDWRALDEDLPRLRDVAPTLAKVSASPAIEHATDSRAFLLALLLAVHTSKLVNALRTRAGADSAEWWLGALSSVCAAHDRFVKPHYSREQHDQLMLVTKPGHAHSTHVGGGHVTAFVTRTTLFVAAVRRAATVLVVRAEGGDRE